MKWAYAVVLKMQGSLALPGGLEKQKSECWALHRDSDSVGLGQGLRMCISTKVQVMWMLLF